MLAVWIQEESLCSTLRKSWKSLSVFFLSFLEENSFGVAGRFVWHLWHTAGCGRLTADPPRIYRNGGSAGEEEEGDEAIRALAGSSFLPPPFFSL